MLGLALPASPASAESGGPDVSISGQVTDSNGSPVANASVSASPSIMGTGGDGWGTTDADGTYTISGLTSGDYRVYFMAPMDSDLISEYYRDTTNYWAATPVTVTAGSTTTGIDAQLVSSGKITGLVLDGSGSPMANVSVSASPSVMGAGGYGSGMTGADGMYTISGLAAGDYRVQFMAPMGSDLINEYYRDTTNYSAATPVTVTAGNTTSDIDAQLATGGKITGRITDGAGNPVANASVAANPAGAGSAGYGNAITSTEGTYTISGLTAGDYRVQFMAPMGSDLINEYYRDTTNYSAATPVTVTAGNTTSDIDAQLATGGKITGRVTDSNGTPIANTIVNASPGIIGTGGSGSATTDADGVYTISGLTRRRLPGALLRADGFGTDQRVLPRHDRLRGSGTGRSDVR